MSTSETLAAMPEAIATVRTIRDPGERKRRLDFLRESFERAFSNCEKSTTNINAATLARAAFEGVSMQ